MKKGDSKKKLWVLISIICVVLVVLVLFLFVYQKNCNDDAVCFNNAFNRCSRARFELVKSGNLYEYRTKGNYFGECRMSVELIRLAAGSEVDLVERFEGKQMKCKVPMEMARTRKIGEIPDLVDYCHGELKEEIYKMIIERMYSYLIENLGTLESEFEAGLVEGV